MLVTVAVLAAMAGGLSRLHLDTTVKSVSAQDSSVTTWTQEQESFGGDPLAVLLTSKSPEQLITGQPLANLVKVEGALAQLPNVSVVYGPGTTLNEIALSIKDLVGEIVAEAETASTKASEAAAAAGEPVSAQEAAAQQAQNVFEAKYGSLVLSGLKTGLPSIANPKFGPAVFLPGGKARPAFHWLVPDVNHVAILVRPTPNLTQSATQHLVDGITAEIKGAGLPLRSFEVTGQPVIAADLGNEIVSELPLLAGLVAAVVLVGFLITRRRVRWWERILPLGVGLVATGLTMALFGWLGVPLSIGLLAFLPIILGVGTDYPIYALRGAKPRMILAAVLASGAGLAVLAFSPLPFVRDLGLALVIGLILSAVLGLVAARLLGLDYQSRLRIGRSRAHAGAPAPGEDTDAVEAASPALEVRRRPAARRRWLACGVAALAAGLAGWLALGSLALNSDPQSLAAGLPALRQGVEAQSVLGASGELDVYVRGTDVLTPAFVAWYEQAQSVLLTHHAAELDPIVSPASLLGWLGPHPTPDQISAGLQILPSYLSSVALLDDQSQAVMAFGVKLGSLETEAKLITSIRSELPPIPAGGTVAITGLPAVAAHSNQLLSDNRLVPNLEGIAAFGLVLVVLLDRRRHAVLAVLAAALATGWGFGVLWITGTPLTPLTVSLGSLTSAVGGEFAVMALGRYAAGRRHPWSAVLIAATTSVVGFAVLAVSRLHLLRQFGLVLAGSVALALLAAWVVVSLDRLLFASTPDAAPDEAEISGPAATWRRMHRHTARPKEVTV